MRRRGRASINTSASMQVIRNPIRWRTSAIGLYGKFIQGGTRIGAAIFPRYTRSHTRDSVHIYTCLASAGARDLRKYSRARRKTRENLSSPHRGSSIRRWKRVKPSDRLFARRINICSSACFYVCPDNFVARNTGTGYVCPNLPLDRSDPLLDVISEISARAIELCMDSKLRIYNNGSLKLGIDLQVETRNLKVVGWFLIRFVKIVGILKYIGIRNLEVR